MRETSSRPSTPWWSASQHRAKHSIEQTRPFQRVYGTLDKPLEHFEVRTLSCARADNVDGVFELMRLAHGGFFRLHSLLLNLRVESICTHVL